MAITKLKKQEIVKKLGEIIKSAKTIVFVNFRGFKVSDSSAFRNTLKSEGSNYYVAKKTLLGRTLAEAKFEGESPVLEGEVGIVYGNEELTPARLAQQFAEKVKEGLKIVGGVFGGKYLPAEEMVRIAKIPARPVLLGQLVNLINSPIAGLVITLNEIAKKKGN